ncbi:MAG: hypothetical protein PHU85_19285 [Phycisphaerae bacterium]|nr:hypothetical protein [Phycisphaerae bacterium]
MRQTRLATILAACVVLAALAGWAWAQERIYVPGPRGEGETIDGGGRVAAGAGDKIATRNGDLLVGKLLDIVDGRIRLTGTQFDGEVKVMLAGVDQITLIPGESAEGKDAVAVSNGDAIMGEVTAINGDEVTIASDCAGPVKVSRKVIGMIGFGKGAGILVDSDFSRSLEPWKTARGTWATRDGVAISEQQGDYNTLVANIEQAKPVTFEAVVEPTSNYSLYCTMALCVDQSNNNNYFGNNSVFVNFSSGNYSVSYCQNGSQNSVANKSMRNVNSGESVTLRMAYDPETKKMKTWVNNTLIGEHEVTNGPATGKQALFATQYPCKVKSLKVTAGFSPPSDTTAAKDDGDLVHFVNKDGISTKSLSLTDGQFIVTTAYGELKSSVDKIDRVVFSPKRVERPRRQKGDVLVQTATSRFTLQLESMTPESLSGTSDYLGKVTIKRAAIRSVRFNIYQ